MSTTSFKMLHEFKKYVDIFSKNEANELSSHRDSFNHFIDFFFGEVLFFASIHNLSKNELTVLKIFINKNFVNDFIAGFKFTIVRKLQRTKRDFNQRQIFHIIDNQHSKKSDKSEIVNQTRFERSVQSHKNKIER